MVSTGTKALVAGGVIAAGIIGYEVWLQNQPHPVLGPRTTTVNGSSTSTTVTNSGGQFTATFGVSGMQPNGSVTLFISAQTTPDGTNSIQQSSFVADANGNGSITTTVTVPSGQTTLYARGYDHNAAQYSTNVVTMHIM